MSRRGERLALVLLGAVILVVLASLATPVGAAEPEPFVVRTYSWEVVDGQDVVELLSERVEPSREAATLSVWGWRPESGCAIITAAAVGAPVPDPVTGTPDGLSYLACAEAPDPAPSPEGDVGEPGVSSPAPAAPSLPDTATR